MHSTPFLLKNFSSLETVASTGTLRHMIVTVSIKRRKEFTMQQDMKNLNRFLIDTPTPPSIVH